MARNVSCKKITQLLNNINFDHDLINYEQGITSKESLNNLLLQKNQFYYLYDFFTRRIINISDTFTQFKIEKTIDKMDLKDLYKLIHPQDRNIVISTTEQVLSKIITDKVTDFQDLQFCIDFRMEKKDGTYIRVLRQSCVNSQDRRGNILNVLSEFTDISNLKKQNDIEAYYYNPVKLEIFPITLKTHKPSTENLFTHKETEILGKLAVGKYTKTIAKELKISPHTVNTHRKNMLQKTNSRNTYSLLVMAEKNGYIHS